ncbi:DUF7933 domain-containing protein [Halopseudomonas salegens]|uniref:DUF7933 domain-containing protein n=1 Tax=Halopseudomonas salegens TaxID=1434072 RepID=A0A1H2G352_9GAMM|nr:hypothetical protein [Halopseudomonas salegens]SDU13940.1 hypothetical protein SAMN05216210_2000 [Halopseudomonas salegens]
MPTFSKTFAPEVITPGSISRLTFSIDNTAEPLPAESLEFTDNLPAGVTIAGVPSVSNSCAGTVTASGGSTAITLLSGSVGANDSCQVAVDVTASTPGIYTNVSGDLTSTAGNSGSATDDLEVTRLAISKGFIDDPVSAGGMVTLRFTLENFTSSAVTSLAFTDDLDATLTGLAAQGLPLADVCGAGSQVSGTSLLTLTGGSLPASGSCTIDITLQVPAGAPPGDYPNITSNLSGIVGGVPTDAPPASDDLQVTVLPLPPGFTKSFSPATVNAGVASTLTFTIDNSAGILPVTGLSFTDNLPAGLVVATPSNSSTTCTGGTLTTVPGSATVAYTGGTVAAGGTCVILVDVSANTPAIYNSISGELATSSGSSGIASATLTVVLAAGAIMNVPTTSSWSLLMLVMLLAVSALWRRQINPSFRL